MNWGFAKPATKPEPTSRNESDGTLIDMLKSARGRIAELEGFFTKMENSSLSIHGYVIKVDGDKVLVGSSQGVFEGVRNPMAKDKKELNLELGQAVRANRENGIVISNSLEIDAGKVYIVQSCDMEQGWVEIDAEGSPHRLSTCSLEKVEDGDRILVDPSLTIALRNYGKDRKRFAFKGETGVSWDDIGGLHIAKEALREAIELPAKHAQIFKAYGKKISKGVMMYGPTGCGKTMLAKAAATSLADTFGAEAKETGFIYVKGPELLDKWVGNTEAMIRGLFAQARDHHKKNGYPAILFIDEADALLGKRGGAKGERATSLSSTIVPQFLSEMDGLEESGAFVLLATNRPDILDPAVVRDGRIDRKVHVTRPDQSSVRDILKINLKNKPICGELDQLVEYAASEICSTEHKLYDVQYTKSGKTEVAEMFYRDLVNGAMIAGIIEQATGEAMNRDIASGNPHPTGIKEEDLREAIMKSLRENSDTNHDIALEEFEISIDGKIKGIRKATEDVKEAVPDLPPKIETQQKTSDIKEIQDEQLVGASQEAAEAVQAWGG